MITNMVILKPIGDNVDDDDSGRKMERFTIAIDRAECGFWIKYNRGEWDGQIIDESENFFFLNIIPHNQGDVRVN